MTEAEYIAYVCRDNSLPAMLDWLIQSDEEEAYYADRHVAVPPANLPKRAACSAGFALLEKWHNGVGGANDRGIFAEGPILMIDQEWLDEKQNAPPPHVVLHLAKVKGRLTPIDTSGHLVDHSTCPFQVALSNVAIRRLDPWPEAESDGAWVFRITTPPISPNGLG
jgi:hypothetical protein